MKYWDSSALLPLLVREETSARMAEVLADDPAIVTWWGSAVECVSGLARLEREGALHPAGMAAAIARLRTVAELWVEVPASPQVREHAMRLLRVHPLRAADALQLAAALVAADFEAGSLELITLDVRQGVAAEREGFRVVGCAGLAADNPSEPSGEGPTTS